MRHAIVTAGTKGLGKKMTEALLTKGYSVTATYRSDREKAEALLDEFEEYQYRLHIVQLDTMDVSSINKAVDQAYEKFGRVDCLISNAGPYIFERKNCLIIQSMSGMRW